MINLKELNFGDQDAYKDALLKTCFIDQGFISQILDKKINYIIGSKGAGKSAIASYILTSFQNSNRLITLLNIEKFYKVKRFLQPLVEDQLIELGELTWKIVLLDELLSSLGRDNSLYIKQEWQDIERIYKTSFGTLRSNATKKERKFEIGLPKVFGPLLETGKLGFSSSVESKIASLFHIESACDEMIGLISELHISNDHIILIDKIDDKYDANPWFLELIKGLVIQVDKFSNIHSNISFVAFLRDDINRRVYYSNFNKLKKQTLTIEWGKYREEAKKNLGNLIKKRIEGALNKTRPPHEAAWTAFHSLYFGAHSSPPFEASSDYLIDRTLWRPRDIIEYCNAIHKEMTSNGLTNSTDRTKIIQALRNAEYTYSQYFLQELIDSCCTEINPIANFDQFKNILMGIREKCFDRKTWVTACSKREISEFDAIKALSILYQHGVIGLYNEEKDESWWHHRTGAGAFNENFKFNVHFGLYKIFQLY